MAKTLIVCGHGPGISDAVARKFGAEGFSVALAARSQNKLTAAAAALEAKGVRAAAFPTNLADPAAVESLVAGARSKLGPIAAIHWNAYAALAGDLLKASAADIRASFDVGVTGLVVAVQKSLDDLRAQKGAVLTTGGSLCMYDAQVDAMAVTWGAMGLAVTKAAQHKLAGLLAEKLRGEGIYVGEVVVNGLVKGTAFDSGNATLEPSDIANKFWELYTTRKERFVTFAG
jgi:NADP-dependent 3-hydroxy acid dehydrogenase YdfG